jgi:hypothetical protein
MDRKDCFGSLKETNLNHSQTTTQSRVECRNCEEIRDCLHYSKQLAEEGEEKDELRKQNMIAQIIDHSHVITNEIGSCLLTFLSRLYSSALGAALFKNLFLFYEVPQNSFSSNLSIPISRTMIDLVQGEKKNQKFPPISKPPSNEGSSKKDLPSGLFCFRDLFQKNQKANMGMIAYEVAHAVACDDLEMKQILDLLPEVEKNLFKKMDADLKTNWLIEKWGFLEEFEALKKEMVDSEAKR